MLSAAVLYQIKIWKTLCWQSCYSIGGSPTGAEKADQMVYSYCVIYNVCTQSRFRKIWINTIIMWSFVYLLSYFIYDVVHIQSARLHVICAIFDCDKYAQEYLNTFKLCQKIPRGAECWPGMYEAPRTEGGSGGNSRWKRDRETVRVFLWRKERSSTCWSLQKTKTRALREEGIFQIDANQKSEGLNSC